MEQDITIPNKSDRANTAIYVFYNDIILLFQTPVYCNNGKISKIT